MDIKTIMVGPLQTNCYLLIKDNSCLIVDPGDDFKLIEKHLSNLRLVGILITHHHPDHIGALDELKNKYQVPVYSRHNLLEKEYHIDSFKFEVIYTFGHTSDSITFYFKEEKAMFVGDFLFKGSIGRYDLPTANYNDMVNSLNNIIKYNDDITIYSGHGPKTTLGDEKKDNPYLQS
ncbi:MAG: MBL fold metallo-hydrolase [Bacilli bacterium]|nr:MBL fold metallo-hydrolase [Bacilli bacterium]MDD4808570.1 MBL fold metallo-hydrolase [Bacilli bacterium]